MAARPASWIKVVAQASCLAAFAALFALTSFPIHKTVPVDAFLRLDPLVTLAASLSGRTALPGMLLGAAVLVSAVVLGRAFCGYVCPLGTLLDLADYAVFRRIRKKAHVGTDASWLRFGLLAFIAAAALCGTALLLWLGPLSLLTRFCTNLAFPQIGRALAGAGVANYQPVIALDFLALVLLTVVFGAALLQERFWCRNICPLGALLGLAGRFGLRPVVNSSCDHCGKCVAICPMGAIQGRPKTVDMTQCHQCLACQRVCPPRSIQLAFPSREGLQTATPGLEPSRRSFIRMCSAGAGGAALSCFPLLKPLQLGKDQRLLRPPGVFDEEAFLERCVRCAECMKVCTYNCLQPVRLEQGLMGMGSPHFVMGVAGCDPACAACGEVCPSGAIPRLPLPKKKAAVIGLAQINRGTCLLWKEQLCDRCIQACNEAGYQAISASFEEGFMRIKLMADKCNGCGWCEHHCPVKEPAAIVVAPSARHYLETT